MTTLDKTEIETARDEFVHSITKEQIERWAYKWADDLLSTAIALSSIPEQAVTFNTETMAADRLKHIAIVPKSADMAEISEMAAMLYGQYVDALSPPSQPAAVGVTDEMVEAALHGRVPGGSSVWVWIAQDDAFKPSETARDVIRAALEAALRSTP